MRPETPLQRASDAAPAYWSIPAEALLAQLDTRISGLSSGEARARLDDVGANAIRAGRGASALAAFARQFRSPLVLILIFAAVVSGIVGEGSEVVSRLGPSM